MMSVNIDKVIESLPGNLMFKTETCQIAANQNLSTNTVWGPFEVEKFVWDMNQAQICGNIKTLDCEWVNHLVEKSANKLLQVPKQDISDNVEGNVTLLFNKRKFQITISTNQDIDTSSDLKCNIVIIDQMTSKGQSHTDESGDCDQNNEKLSKICKFCGISFSHQCTLDAHMTYYCSKRQSLLNESTPSPKLQKTWRTRQRNKQTANQKVIPCEVFNTNRIVENSSQFIVNERGISSNLRLKGIKGSEQPVDVNSMPIISHPTVQKTADVATVILTNGNSLGVKCGETEKMSGQIGSNSDTEPENGISNPLGFCAPCGLFFSSKELYNIHIQLDISSFQSSAAKCNSLVIAAPVFNNNGLQYVPIHPRTAILNPTVNKVLKTNSEGFDDSATSVPLDLSVNSSTKSPINNQNDRVQNDVSNRIAVMSNLAVTSCNHILRSNKRPFLCQHCQTRFQLYSTFQAHQEFYCQGKRQHVEVLEKRCRTTSNNSSQNDVEVTAAKNDDVSWKFCNQGFKCEGCGFIGQTKRGIRIHCKNQCSKRLQDQRSESKCDEVETCSPSCEVWPGYIVNQLSTGPTEISELSNQDSPVKVESI